jgi:hypothetical protein
VFYNGVRLGDILAFGFGLNDATGNHIAGTPAKCIVRRAGDAADAAAIASTDATHLTHANVPVGLYEYVFSVSADTYSVTAGQNYLIYAYASASGLSTVACIGGFRIAAPAVNVVQFDGGSASAGVSAVIAAALANYDVPTSADVSALVSSIGHIAALSALRAVGVLSAQAASVVVAQALADYDVPTSADLSVALSVHLQNRISAGWKIMTLVEPAAPIDFASVTPAGALSWLTMLATNRMVQASTNTIIQNAAGAEIASASVAYDGTTFIRGPWVG